MVGYPRRAGRQRQRVVDVEVARTQGETPYFAVFEAEFADAVAVTASRSWPQGHEVAADVANYATGGAVVIRYQVHDETAWRPDEARNN